MIVGEEKPDGGTLTIGETVKIAYVDQSRDALDPTRPSARRSPAGTTIIELGKREVNSRAYVSRFNFRGADQQKQRRRRSRAASATASTWRSCCSRRQRAAARRADERPRRRHAARAGGGAPRLRRLRRRHQPRPLVPRPRSRRTSSPSRATAGRVVRGQLPGVRGEPPRAASAPTPTSRTGSSTSRSCGRSPEFYAPT